MVNLPAKEAPAKKFFRFFGKSERFSGLLHGKPEKTRNTDQ